MSVTAVEIQFFKRMVLATDPIDTDPQLKSEFRQYIGHTEIHKFLSDIVESSQNILLVADGTIAELPEIMATYTDTWGRIVKCIEIR